jgi:hypothetical protein
MIFSPGRIDQTNDFWVGWPYKFAADPNLPKANESNFQDYLDNQLFAGNFDLCNWEKRKILISMVAANKVSPIKHQNYSIRRKIAKEIPRTHLQVYGLLWNDSIATKVKHRLGVFVFNLRQGHFPNLISIYGRLFTKFDPSFRKIDDKHSILRDSKFTIVIENCNSYASEKLVDALVNGCIPLYVGPKLASIGLPENIAIQVSGNASEILKITQKIEKIEVQQYLTSVLQLLKSEKFRTAWTEESVYNKIAEKLFNFIGYKG